MTDAVLVLLLLAASGALVAVRFGPRWRAARQRRALLEPVRGVAVRHQGEIVERPRVAFARTGRFTLAIVPDREEALEPGVPFHVRFEAPFQSAQFLEVWPRGSRFAPLRLTIARDVTLAAQEFEQYFIVRADDAGFARAVLTPLLREKVYGLWSLGGGGLVRLDLYPHKMAVQKEEAMAGVYFLPFVEKCLELRTLLEASVKEQEGVQWLDAPPAEARGTCPICGSPLKAGRVSCLKCKTSHHRECWEWNGGCSMFACGESRFELT